MSEINKGVADSGLYSKMSVTALRNLKKDYNSVVIFLRRSKEKVFHSKVSGVYIDNFIGEFINLCAVIDDEIKKKRG